MKKRILSLLLCLVMVVGLLPVTAQADMNMADYHGKRITEIVLEASIDSTKIPDYLSSITADSNAYDASKKIVEVGKKLGNGKYMIRFNPISYTYTNGTATTTFDNSGATELLKVEISGIRWQKSDGKWDWASDQMTHYLDGQYRYQFNVSVVESKEDNANEYRIVPNVKVTVNWENSSVQETLTVDPKRVYNHDESFHSYATFTTAPFAATVDTGLKLVAAGSIPSGYANEAIKSFSVASWASGGTKPYTFSKVSGPDGIEVNSDGTVSGAPTEESDSPKKLKIKVTDASGFSDTTDITVGAVKAERTVINTIKIAGLSYPRVDDVVPEFPGVYVTEINGGAVSLENSPIRLAMRFWKDDEGNHIYNAQKDAPNTPYTFINGEKYVFNMQVRLEGAETCAQYRLDEDLKVIVPSITGGEAGHNTLTKTNQTNLIEEADYAYLSVSSPEWVPVDTGNILTGTVSYSGAARYGQRLTANVTGLPEGVSKADLSYQWQFKNKDHDIWYDVYYNDTGESITLNDELGISDLVGRDIRVTVRCTGTNYAGTLFGAPVTVGKNWNMGIPEKPVIGYDATSSKLTITSDSWKGDAGTNTQEYAWTTSLTRDETTGYAVWPTDSTVVEGTDQSLSSVTAGQTYYVYTRVKGSKTMEPGRIISAVAYTVPFADGSSSGGESGAPTSIWANDMVYPDYDSKTPTIYLKKGEQITVRYQLDPNNADANLPQWKGTYDVINSTKVGDVTVTHNADNKTITIQAPANATGTATVVAYKQTENTPWYYGTSGDSSAGRQITVMIYDPADLANVPFSKAYLGTTELYVNDTYEITKAALLDLPFVPADVEKSNYTLAAMFTNYGTGGSSGVITRSDTNAFVSLSSDTEKFVIKGNAVTDSSVYVEFFALPNEKIEVGAYGSYAIAALNVTVKARPTVLDLSITPPVLTLQAGKTYQLVATKTLANADAESGITWESNNSAVTVTPDANDSSKATVTVSTGAGAGTAIITATYGTGETALKANCIITVTAACGENHAYVLYQEQDWGHKKVCLFCGEDEKENGKIKVEPHDLYESTEDPNVLLCSYCDHSAKLTADTTDETVAPSSPSGGHHGGAGRPYRPDLSTAVPEGTTAAKPNSDVKSPGTGDAGIMLYAALSLMSMTGGAWLVSKKRRDR